MARFDARLRLAIAALLLTHVLGPVTASAQAVRRIELRPADATFAEEFTGINSVRELRDGRLLVTDGREQRIVLLDPTGRPSEQVGRSGRGPGEYSNVSWLHVTSGDSSIMWDILARRWLLFDGPRIVGTVPPDDSALLATRAMILGADGLGNVLSERDADRRDGLTLTGAEDSTELFLVARATGRVTSATKLLNTPRRIEIVRKPDGTITSSSTMVRTLMPTEEQAILLADGTIAVARLDPFRLDFRSPTGQWTRGAPLPIKAARFDARERAAWEARRARNAARNGQRLASAPPVPNMPTDFPEFVPPIPLSLAMKAGPGGVVIVQRAPSADVTRSQYLVVDRKGALLGEIILPLEQTIVGAGAKHVYVAVRDEDDLIRIRRHPWP